MRAPLAPIGWPRAIAPPWTFTRSASSLGARQHATDRVDGRDRKLRRGAAGARRRDDARARCETVTLHGGGTRDDKGRRAVGERRGVRGGDRAVALEARTQRRDAREIDAARLLVAGDDRRPAAC